MRYLLDTPVVSDFTRGVPAVLARLKATSKGDAAICTATAMEIKYGLVLNPVRARKIEPTIRSLLQDLHVTRSRSGKLRFKALTGLCSVHRS